MAMTVREKIADREAKIQACIAKIDALEKKKEALQKEVANLRNDELSHIIQTINLPFEEVCDFLKSLNEPPKSSKGD